MEREGGKGWSAEIFSVEVKEGRIRVLETERVRDDEGDE